VMPFEKTDINHLFSENKAQANASDSLKQMMLNIS